MRIFLFAAFALISTIPSFAAAQLAPRKLIVVMFENTSYREALNQPFFAKFASDGLLFTNFHAITHPSQPNYIALMAGSTLSVMGDGNVDLNESNIADLLEAKGKKWRVYGEDYPGNCFTGKSSGRYDRKHNPLISFNSIHNNPTRCANFTDTASFMNDFKSRKLADFTMYIPNSDDSGHDTNSAFASRWFEQTFSPLLQDPANMAGVIIVALFDEDDFSSNNQIYVAMGGPDIVRGTQISTQQDTYSLLRTFEDLLHLDTLGRNDASRIPVTGFLK